MQAGTRVIPAHEYQRLRWANQAGWTREIQAWPATGPWSWRLSIAELEAPAPFSLFPGVAREMVLLRGQELRLHLGDARTVELRAPHGRLRFDGGQAVAGEPGQRCEVFNLMWRPQEVDATLWHRPLAGAMLIFVDPGTTWALHLLGGQAMIGGETRLPGLAAGDTALLSAPGRRARFVVEGGGEVLLARLAPAEAGNGPAQ